MTRRDRERLVYDVLRRKRRGESIRQIARTKGIDRKTVRRILDEHAQRLAQGDDALERELPKARAPRPSKLDPYTDQIDQLLDEFADITAQRVFEEIKAEGFDGGYTIVKAYVRKKRPKPVRRAFDPVYTPPGKQGQVDWSPHTLPGCGVDVNTFSLILHYSSWQYADFARDRRQITLFRNLRAGFEDIDGVPFELVFDSEKTVVDRWELGEPIINLGMADFAAYYGFEIHIAPRADGPYKGAVERPFWTIEQNFFNGRKFKDFEDARARLKLWRDRFATRKHGTKRRTRVEMFAEDQPKLQPLPAHPYDTSEIVWRIADGYHRIAFETNTYTVPRSYVGYRLCVRASEDKVQIYDGAVRLLATHGRVPRGAHDDRELPEHRRQRRIDIDKLIERFEAWGHAAATFAKHLRSRQRYAGVELTKILGMQARYRVEDILSAIDHALVYAAYKASALERILQVRAQPLSPEDVVTRRIRADIQRALAQVPVRQRQLRAYQELLDSHKDDHSETTHDRETSDDTEGSDDTD